MTRRDRDSRSGPDDRLEREFACQGLEPVAGVDEAGRGPLAGPVVAAAVILDWERVPPGINDSKQLTCLQRGKLARAIEESARDCHVALASPEEIDRLNIRQASLLAMRRALAGLTTVIPRAVLVDGRDLPPGLPCPGRGVVKGDTLSLSIAAASILAKVARDGIMAQLAVQYPGYGWDHNQGYPTAQHREALETLGVTPVHRRTFAPVRARLARG